MGVKSFTFNYSTQGVGCYVKSFLAQLVNDAAQLTLELGSNYHIRTIEWQQLISGNHQTMQTITPVNGLLYNYTNTDLMQGVNIYRVKIILENGQVIYSEEKRVNYLSGKDYIFFPNPVLQSQTFYMLSKQLDKTTYRIFNSYGIQVFEKTAVDMVVNFSANGLSKGLYFIRVMKNNQWKETIKLVVL